MVWLLILHNVSKTERWRKHCRKGGVTWLMWLDGGFLKRSAPDVMVRLAQTFKKLRALFHAEYHIRMGTRLRVSQSVDLPTHTDPTHWRTGLTRVEHNTAWTVVAIYIWYLWPKFIYFLVNLYTEELCCFYKAPSINSSAIIGSNFYHQ